MDHREAPGMCGPGAHPSVSGSSLTSPSGLPLASLPPSVLPQRKPSWPSRALGEPPDLQLESRAGRVPSAAVPVATDPSVGTAMSSPILWPRAIHPTSQPQRALYLNPIWFGFQFVFLSR